MASKIPVAEHLTFKSGKFVFSCEHDAALIMPKVLEAKILYQTVTGLPILPHVSARMQTDLVRRSIFGTAAIEGNKLTEDEVEAVLTSKKREELSNRSELEIDNLKRAYAFLEKKGQGGPWKVREKFIKDVHNVLTRGLDYYHNSPGLYRNEPVYVGNPEHGGTYTPPKILVDIENLMRIFVEWINCKEMLETDAMIRAAAAHFHLARIHPFQDGNGRTARFIEAMVMHGAGIKYLPQMMSNYYYRNIDDYFIAFSSVHKSKNRKDITPFLSFFFDGVIESLKEIKEQVTYSIRQMSIRDFVYFQKKNKALSKRQADLLLLCLETLKPFTLSDLFSHPVMKHLYAGVSESTARRDLKKLYDEGYLRLHKDKKEYLVNLLMLG
ncbi:Fic family protein [Pseudodesulfovibrio tunisiensis]|uniref:Fic family protein n=1 Tax=Pseudodesulfovibrio tunisiensis TaxID=463192 RepID=UPI001FB351F1|nr:Fic family protein [Pseudodesulfovibrio tunisiensis]